jgi:Spy/CpxP family protein refolding chaperone
MKKFLLMTFILGALISTTANAQPAAESPTVLQQMKEQQKPGLIEKVGLTEAQADKIIEINYETRMQAAKELQGLNDADRNKKLAAVKAYYEEMGKNMQKKPGN